jgi:hypothetical protein
MNLCWRNFVLQPLVCDGFNALAWVFMVDCFDFLTHCLTVFDLLSCIAFVLSNVSITALPDLRNRTAAVSSESGTPLPSQHGTSSW